VSNALSGVGLILAIVAVAGFVAYIGDRVGHQVGRRRLTLFGLRPKYTSTIVAVGTGMLIALAVTVVALLVSNEVRTAFFRLNQLDRDINTLQAQSLAQKSEVNLTRTGDLEMPKFSLLVNIACSLDPASPVDDQLMKLSQFFDQTVALANAQLTKPPYNFKAYKRRSSDPDIQKELREELAVIGEKATRASQVLGVPVAMYLIPQAYQNMFSGDQIAFSFGHYVDTRLATAGETLASIDVDGGTSINLGLLLLKASTALGSRGMPAPFLQIPAYNQQQTQDINSQLARLRGRYRVSAKASFDLYPHSGGVAYDFSLSPIR
jgi:hypothetical protein